jgi:hypothetical protein
VVEGSLIGNMCARSGSERIPVLFKERMRVCLQYWPLSMRINSCAWTHRVLPLEVRIDQSCYVAVNGGVACELRAWGARRNGGTYGDLSRRAQPS